MRKYVPFLLAGLLAGCAENTKKPLPEADSAVSTTTVTENETPLPDKIIGERTKGTVTLLDTIDGKPLISLTDNVLLDATAPRQGWVEANIEMAITPAQEKSMLIKKGQVLKLEGKTIGKALDDLHLSTTGQSQTTRETTGYCLAYIKGNEIKRGSVIETALQDYLSKNKGRLLPDIQPFIKQFQLQTTPVNAPFLEYQNYENSVDDPSPMYRMVLVFYKNELIGIVASRPLQLKNVSHKALERGFTVYFLDGTAPKVMDEYVKVFNNFITNVD